MAGFAFPGAASFALPADAAIKFVQAKRPPPGDAAASSHHNVHPLCARDGGVKALLRYVGQMGVELEDLKEKKRELTAKVAALEHQKHSASANYHRSLEALRQEAARLAAQAAAASGATTVPLPLPPATCNCPVPSIWVTLGIDMHRAKIMPAVRDAAGSIRSNPGWAAAATTGTAAAAIMVARGRRRARRARRGSRATSTLTQARAAPVLPLRKQTLKTALEHTEGHDAGPSSKRPRSVPPCRNSRRDALGTGTFGALWVERRSATDERVASAGAAALTEMEVALAGLQVEKEEAIKRCQSAEEERAAAATELAAALSRSGNGDGDAAALKSHEDSTAGDCCRAMAVDLQEQSARASALQASIERVEKERIRLERRLGYLQGRCTDAEAALLAARQENCELSERIEEEKSTVIVSRQGLDDENARDAVKRGLALVAAEAAAAALRRHMERLSNEKAELEVALVMQRNAAESAGAALAAALTSAEASAKRAVKVDEAGALAHAPLQAEGTENLQAAPFDVILPAEAIAALVCVTAAQKAKRGTTSAAVLSDLTNTASVAAAAAPAKPHASQNRGCHLDAAPAAAAAEAKCRQETAEAACARAMADLESARDRILLLESSLSEFERERGAAEAATAAARGEVARLEQQVAALEAELESSAASAASDLGALLQKRDELREQLAASDCNASAAAATAANDIAALQARLEEQCAALARGRADDAAAWAARLAAADARVEEHSAAANEARRETAEGEARYAATFAELSALLEARDALSASLREAEAARASAETAAAKVGEETALVKRQLEQSEARLKELVHQRNSLLTAVQVKSAQLEGEKQALDELRAAAAEQFRLLAARISEAEEQLLVTSRALDAERTAKAAQSAEAAAVRKRLEERCAALAAERTDDASVWAAQLTAADQQIQELTAAWRGASTDVTAAEARCTATLGELTAAQGALVALSVRVQQAEQATESAQAAEAEAAREQTRLGELLANQDVRVAELEQQRVTLSAAVTEKTAQLDEERQAALQASAAAAEQARTAAADAHCQEQRLSEATCELDSSRTANAAAVAAWGAQRRQLEDEIAAMSAKSLQDATASAAELAVLRADAEAAAREAERAHDEAAAVEEQRVEIEADLASLTEAYDARSVLLANAVSAISEKETALAEAAEGLGTARRLLREREARVADLERQRDTLSAAVSQKTAQLEVLVCEADELRAAALEASRSAAAQLLAMEAKAAASAEELDASRAAASAATAEAAAVRERLEEQCARLAAEKADEVEVWAKRLADEEEGTRQSNAAKDGAQERAAAAEARLSAASAELEALEEERDALLRSLDKAKGAKMLAESVAGAAAERENVVRQQAAEAEARLAEVERERDALQSAVALKAAELDEQRRCVERTRLEVAERAQVASQEALQLEQQLRATSERLDGALAANAAASQAAAAVEAQLQERYSALTLQHTERTSALAAQLAAAKSLAECRKSEAVKSRAEAAAADARCAATSAELKGLTEDRQLLTKRLEEVGAAKIAAEVSVENVLEEHSVSRRLLEERDTRLLELEQQRDALEAAVAGKLEQLQKGRRQLEELLSVADERDRAADVEAQKLETQLLEIEGELQATRAANAASAAQASDLERRLNEALAAAATKSAEAAAASTAATGIARELQEAESAFREQKRALERRISEAQSAAASRKAELAAARKDAESAAAATATARAEAERLASVVADAAAAAAVAERARAETAARVAILEQEMESTSVAAVAGAEAKDAEIASLQDRLGSALAALAQQQEEYQRLEQEKREAVAAHAATVAAERELRVENDRRAADADCATTQVLYEAEALRKEVRRQDGEMERLQKKHDAAVATAAAAQGELEDLREASAAFERELSKAREAAEAAAAERDLLTTQLREMTADFQALREADAARVSRLTADLAAATAAASTTALAAPDTVVVEHNSDQQLTTAEDGEATALRTRVSELEHQRSEQTARLEDITKEMERAEKRVRAAIDKERRRAARAEEALKGSEASVVALEAELAARSDEVEQLTSALAEARQQLDTRASAVRHLWDKIGAMRRSYPLDNSGSSSSSSIARLSLPLPAQQRCQDDEAELLVHLERARAERDELRETVAAQEQQLDRLKRRAALREDEIAKAVLEKLKAANGTAKDSGNAAGAAVGDATALYKLLARLERLEAAPVPALLRMTASSDASLHGTEDNATEVGESPPMHALRASAATSAPLLMSASSGGGGGGFGHGGPTTASAMDPRTLMELVTWYQGKAAERREILHDFRSVKAHAASEFVGAGAAPAAEKRRVEAARSPAKGAAAAAAAAADGCKPVSSRAAAARGATTARGAAGLVLVRTATARSPPLSSALAAAAAGADARTSQAAADSFSESERSFDSAKTPPVKRGRGSPTTAAEGQGSRRLFAEGGSVAGKRLARPTWH